MNRFLGILAVVLMLGACGSDGPDPAPNGEACVENGDCESGLCVSELAPTFPLPDGLCTNDCNVSLQDCAEQEVCLIYNPTGAQNCYQLCNVTDECREGWSCQFISPNGPVWACIPAAANQQ